MIEVTQIKHAYKIEVDMDYIIVSIEEWAQIKHKMAMLLKE